MTHKFKIGDRVKQPSKCLPDRTYTGTVERRTAQPGAAYYVRWHRGYASWEVESDLEAA